MDTLLQDLRFALRQLARNRGFTAVALVTLAVGIGANTAIFSVLNSVLIRPLPYDRPEELVQIQMTNPEYAAERRYSSSHFGVNVLDYEEYRAHSSTIQEMGYVTQYADEGTIQVGSGRGVPEEVWAWGVSSSLFATLGVQPMMGRVFLDEERAPPGDMRYTEVAIVSHELWQRRFGSDPDIVGKTITLDAGPSTVVGVMPPGFDLPPMASQGTVVSRHADVYLPMYYQAYQQPRRFHQVDVIGRLAPNTTLEAAQADVSRLANGLREAYPEDMTGWSVLVSPLHAALAENYGGGLYLLMGAVGLVLLIVCGNVANLLTVRNTSRSAEIAVRMALGSGRVRLVRMLLTETMVLALLGGVAGVLLAIWSTDALVSIIPTDIPRAAEAGLDVRVLGFAVGLSLATGLLFGLLPAFRAARSSPIEGLKIGMTGRSGGRGLGRGSQLLVVGQVMTAVVLLIGAGILAKSFLRLQATDRGYEAHGVLVAEVTFGAHHVLTEYIGNASERTPERRAERARRGQEFWDRAVEEIERMPGVESVAGGAKPLSGSGAHWPLLLEGNPEPQYHTLMDWVTPGYFRTMQIPLLRGRPLPVFSTIEAGRAASNWNGSCEDFEELCVVVVSESLARTVWPGEDPLGKRIGIYDCCLTVIGVVADATFRGVDDPPMFHEFDTKFNNYQPATGGGSFIVRATGNPALLIGPVRRVLLSLEPEANVTLSTLEDDIAASLARPRFYMVLIGLFASVAVGLAMVGLYGVIAFAVAQRTREIGLRMALGAERADVLSMVVRQGMVPMVIGIVAGVVAATALSRVLTGVLYGMEPVDPTVFAMLSAVLAAVGLLATYLPARRASKVAPMEALRYE